MPFRSNQVKPEDRKRLDAIPDHAWTPFEVTPDYVLSWAPIEIDGKLETVIRTQYLADNDLIEANAREYEESKNKRWGDGRVVARIPLNKWFAELRNGVKEGDHDHMKWWLEQEENRPFRTFKGKL